jgi:hypothetical protein
MDQVIEPVAAGETAGRTKKAVGGEAGLGDLRPKRARIHGVQQS